LILDICIY